MTKSAVYTGKETFHWDRELTEVTFAKGVTSIGEDAFCECSSLTAITIPDGVTTIDTYAFSGCSSLKSITIPDGVTTIGERAFSGCSSLTTITIPDSVTTIGDGAFDGCSSLTAITIPDGVTTIGHHAFWRCSSLMRISLSPAVSIRPTCFSYCTALIAAAASQNMPTVEALLHSRWHRILERVTVLWCLKTLLEDQDNPNPITFHNPNGGEAQTLGVTAVRKRLPKVMWRVILEFL